MAGFRYLLALENGNPADAAMLIAAVPDWRRLMRGRSPGS
jgi:hypothetical protein